MRAWIYVVVAGLLEVAWASGMKSSQGFTRPIPTAFTLVTMLISFALLAAAMRTLPMGVAYPVWVGIGAVGSALAGSILHGERLAPGQWACVALIAGGILGLKALGKGSA